MRCRKIARCCGEKHILKSKCTKHASFGALFEDAMSKKCTPLWRNHLMRQNCAPLWRNAFVQVKMYKTRQFRSTFQTSDAPKLRAAVAKSICSSQNVQNTSVSEKNWCRFTRVPGSGTSWNVIVTGVKCLVLATHAANLFDDMKKLCVSSDRKASRGEARD